MRFLEVESPELRTVFEVYGALALGTRDPNADERGPAPGRCGGWDSNPHALSGNGF